MKEYGYAGLGVYLAISFIDLPICYVLVHSMGKEQIEYYENKVKQTFGYGVSDEELQKKHEISKIEEMNEQSNSEEVNENGSFFHDAFVTVFMDRICNCIRYPQVIDFY